MRVTGERVSTPAGGFGPTWQRHVAAYAAAAELLPEGRVLDLGCGVGHSFHLLAPRETVGVDVAAGVLAGQDRETLVADMRALPLPQASFASVLSVQSLEHVPDPDRVVAETRRVLRPGGTAVFVTPNRLTFGLPGEIVDPYHHVEFDEASLRAVCESQFDSVDLRGLFGSPRYLAIVARERARLRSMVRRDPLRLRRLMPRRLRQAAYDAMLRRERAAAGADELAIDVSDFELRDGPLAESLDLVAICR
ncbi:MAG TPA: class I SAM-dependent methyltransferase [Thermoleophilaceae bacterium]|nr:class I SAM-dependent methyltransferase [Thermoleophilaceae bacterium]